MKHKTQTFEPIDKQQPQSGAKIIPFPGVVLQDDRYAEDEAPDRLQNDLENFLREMGYID